MAKVWIDRSECRRPGRLPNICLVCGAEADGTVTRNFVWHPRWTYWFLLLGVIWVFFLHLATRQSMVVSVPVCRPHRSHWAKRTTLMILGTLGILVTLFAVPIAYIESVRDTPRQHDGSPGWVLLGTGIGCVVLALVVFFFVRRGVNVDEITRHDIVFIDAAPEFERALETHRDEWDREQYKREDRRRAKATHVIRAKPVRRGDGGE